MKKFTAKNLLICSYYLPPTKTVATIRLFNFHLQAQKYFKEVYSMTTSNRKLFPKDDFDFDDKKTTEVWTYDLRTFLNSEKNSAPSIPEKTKENRLVQFIMKLSYSFPFNLFLADGGLTYILGGFLKGKKLVQQKNIEVLFSSYKPYSNHLICYLLKMWNPKLVWMADFRDLHVDEVRKNVFFPKLQHWFNRQVLKKADVVTTVSKGLANQLTQYHSNVYVLRNAIPSNQFSANKEKSFDKFTISYTGSIYPQLQAGELFFKAVQKLILENKIDEEKIQVIYAGKETVVWSKWMEDFQQQKISVLHGFLPLEKSKEIQHKSHINLLLSWASESQQGILTAKFYEYLLAQNPILLIINGCKDQEFEDIFSDLQAGQVVYNETHFQKDIEDFILKYYHEWMENETVTRSIRTEKLARFSWDYQMMDFMKFLEGDD